MPETALNLMTLLSAPSIGKLLDRGLLDCGLLDC